MPPFKNRFRFLVLNFLWLLFFLFCFELILRALGLGYDNAAFEPDSVFHHAHKKNYSFINNNPSEKEYSNILVKYDNDGCVTNPLFEKKNLPQKKIAILGDSYPEGLQANYTQSLTGILEKEMGNEFQIKNFAVGGYSPVIYYLQCKNILEDYKPDYILLFLYANDVREDKEFLTKAVFKNNELMAVDGGMPAWKYAFIRNSYLLRLVRKYYMQLVYFFYQDDNASAGYSINNMLEEKPVLTPPTLSYLDSIKNYSENSGAKLIISAIPSKYKIINSLPFDNSDYAVQCKLWAAKNTIDYIDLVAPFEMLKRDSGISPFFTKDIHLNTVGHAVSAASIKEYFRK